MKTIPLLLALATLAGAATLHAGAAPAAPAAPAAEAKPPAAPNKGKILEVDEVHAEFLVRSDRTVEVFLYDEKMQPLAPAAQTVTIVAQAKDGNVTQTLDKKEKSYLSAKPLPAGEGYTVVVQIRLQADKPPRNFRIPLILEMCDECKLPEYACTCEDHDHDHAPAAPAATTAPARGTAPAPR